MAQSLKLVSKGSPFFDGFRLFVLTVTDSKLRDLLKNLASNRGLWFGEYKQALELSLSVNGIKCKLPGSNAVNPGLPALAKNLRLARWYDPKSNTFAFWARFDIPVGASLPTPASIEPRATEGLRRGTSSDVFTAFDLGGAFGRPMPLEVWAPIAPPKAAPAQAAKPKPTTPKPSDPVSIISPKPNPSGTFYFDENGLPTNDSGAIGNSVRAGYTAESFKNLQRELIKARSGAGLYPPNSQPSPANVAGAVASSPSNLGYLAAAGVAAYFFFGVG